MGLAFGLGLGFGGHDLGVVGGWLDLCHQFDGMQVMMWHMDKVRGGRLSIQQCSGGWLLVLCHGCGWR